MPKGVEHNYFVYHLVYKLLSENSDDAERR